jgi:hypothetical protein
MNDDELLTAVREQRTKVPMTVPVDQIISRGRAVRARRRIRGAVSGLAVVTAAAVVLGLGLSGAFGSAPARSTGTIRTAAFTLAEHANGTATLTLSAPVLLDPSVLQRDLRQDGIPAVVTAGSFCSSHPIPSGFTQVVSGPPGPNATPNARLTYTLTYTINPAAMPAGTELSFGTEKIPNPPAYANRPLRTETFMELIDTNSYTCSSTLPEPYPLFILNGEGAGVEYIPGAGWALLYPAGS